MVVCDVITFNRFAQESSSSLLIFHSISKQKTKFKATSRENESKTNIYVGSRKTGRMKILLLMLPLMLFNFAFFFFSFAVATFYLWNYLAFYLMWLKRCMALIRCVSVKNFACAYVYVRGYNSHTFSFHSAGECELELVWRQRRRWWWRRRRRRRQFSVLRIHQIWNGL